MTIASRFVKGAPLSGEGSLLAKFAGAGYQQVRACVRACVRMRMRMREGRATAGQPRSAAAGSSKEGGGCTLVRSGALLYSHAAFGALAPRPPHQQLLLPAAAGHIHV